MRKQAISIALVLSGLVVLAGILTDWRMASGYVMGAAGSVNCKLIPGPSPTVSAQPMALV